MVRAILVLVIIIGLVHWFMPSGGDFQGQPVVTFAHAGCYQRCAGGQWVWFSDPEMRWTDGNLHLITEGVYRGGIR